MKTFKIKLSNDEKLGLMIQARHGFGSIMFFLFLTTLSTIFFFSFLSHIFEEIKYSSLEQVKDTATIKYIWEKYNEGDVYYEYWYEFVVDSKKYHNSFNLDEMSFNKNDKINISYPINHPDRSKIEGSGGLILKIGGFIFVVFVLGVFITYIFLDAKEHYDYSKKVSTILEHGVMTKAIQKEKTITENDNDGTIFLTYHLVFEYHISNEIKNYFFDIEEYDYKEKLYKEEEQIAYSVSNPNLAVLTKELPYPTYIEDRISQKQKSTYFN